MSLLVASLVALALGPLFWQVAVRSPRRLEALDGFVFVTISWLVLEGALPEAFDLASWWTLVALALGMAGPAWIEGRLQHSARHAHTAALVLACLGLALHALLDGVALGGAEPETGLSGLSGAIVLHRLPVGITLWWLVVPSYGWVVAAGGLGFLGLSTVAGFAMGEQVTSVLPPVPLGFFWGLLCGSLLHVVLHRAHPLVAEPTGSSRVPAALGGAFGVVFLLAMSFFAHGGGDDGLQGTALYHAGFWQTFLHLWLISAPALVLAYLAAGLIQAFLPRATVAWMGKGSPLAQAGRGVAFGLPLPICSCGVIPVYRSLIAQGVPPAAALAFLVATPELGLDALLISVPLLGVEMTGARLVAAAVVALLLGWILGGWMGRGGAVQSPELAPAVGSLDADQPLLERLRGAVSVGFGQVLDETGPWILVGLAVAAALEPAFDAAWISQLPPGLEVALFAVLGMPVYVCASGATPLVAVLVAQGVSPGAGIAFLIAGPATNVTTFGVLKSLHGTRVALSFGLGILGLCVGLGWGADLILDGVFVAPLALGHEGGSSAFTWACAALLALAFAVSVVRQGPRGFVGQVVKQASGENHSHEQGPVGCNQDKAGQGAEPDGCCS